MNGEGCILLSSTSASASASTTDLVGEYEVILSLMAMTPVKTLSITSTMILSMQEFELLGVKEKVLKIIVEQVLSMLKSYEHVPENLVFLSFCGQDTRDGFTDFLCTSLHGPGVCTFRDNESLHAGEEIGPKLLKAITDSKIYIPVFSKNYASSKSCMLELAQMSGTFEEAFRQHRKKRYGEKIIQGWKEALTKLDLVEPMVELDSEKPGVESLQLTYTWGNVIKVRVEPGGPVLVQGGAMVDWFDPKWRLLRMSTSSARRSAGVLVIIVRILAIGDANERREGELAKIVVEEVLSKLKKNYQHVPKNLVGMDFHIKELEGLLKVDSNGVRIIGILGMGGLGKITIAKVIYNKLSERFDSHCFIEDVREKSQLHNGIVNLQTQLLFEILEREISKIDDDYQGLDRINDAVHGKKVLLVLDDVDKMSQIEKLVGNHNCYDVRSRIVVTTRNEEVLIELELTCQKESLHEVYTSYKPDFMNGVNSLKLFSKFAFKEDSPPEGYDGLATEAVYTVGGLPLVLVTLGLLLFIDKDKISWQEKLKKLKAIPPLEILGRLRISYDALDNAQKQIFLDIACFFSSNDETNPCYMEQKRSKLSAFTIHTLKKLRNFRILGNLRHLRFSIEWIKIVRQLKLLGSMEVDYDNYQHNDDNKKLREFEKYYDNEKPIVKLVDVDETSL
ncbi:hypothetical protein LguiA_030474 [Lonicera macranthoides]